MREMFRNLIEFIEGIFLGLLIIFSSFVIGVLLALLAIPLSLIAGILLACFLILDPYI